MALVASITLMGCCQGSRIFMDLKDGGTDLICKCFVKPYTKDKDT